jgi:predicted nucleic acid-binding protein
MLAIDTNLIVRYLTGDHPKQSARARALIGSEDVFVCLTVLLETEWVLRSVYDYTAAQLARALCAFAGLPHVAIEDAGLAAQALDWMEAGMDFADALHLAKGAWL